MVIQAEVFDGADVARRERLWRVRATKVSMRSSRRSKPRRPRRTAAVRDDVLFPGDYIKNVNRGRIELAGFQRRRGSREGRSDPRAHAKGGKDPFKGKTGDFERHYLLQGANEIMPYRVYVPKALRGIEGDAARDRAARPRRQRRFVLRFVFATAAAARREARLPDGGAARLPPRRLLRLGDHGRAATRHRARRGEYSEKDVLEVLRLDEGRLQRR